VTLRRSTARPSDEFAPAAIPHPPIEAAQLELQIESAATAATPKSTATSRGRRELEKTSTPGVFKRGRGYVIRFRDPQGQQRQASARTLAEARRLRSELAADVSRGEYRPTTRTTFAEYAATWLETYQGRTTRGIRPETIRDYKAELDRFAIPLLGRLRMSEIEPRHIKQLASAVSDRGLAPATVRLALAPVRALFATAVEEGVLRSNPTVGVRVAKPATLDEDDRPEKALTDEQLGGLLAAVPEKYRPFVAFVSQTGMRISEAVAVRWSDVDLERGTVSVRRRWYRNEYAPPKTRQGRRTIPLAPSMSDLLARRHAAVARGDDDLVWPNDHGNSLDPANLASRVLKPAALDAGVPWASWHTLRHTCGSRLFREGWNVKAVQTFLGHANPGFTLSVYVHFFEDDMPSVAFLDRRARIDLEGPEL
jgi:integrase